ncbi:MAG: DUF805 domain-containing protein [Pseudomonadota bacterium]
MNAERPSTLAALRGSFDWTGRSGRLAFGLGFIVYIAAWVLVFVAAEINLNTDILFPLVALLLFVFVAQTRRRLRDAGWPGGVTWRAGVPLMGLVWRLCVSCESPLKPRELAKMQICAALGLL